jgi:type VI secretion system secreted protein VgrG
VDPAPRMAWQSDLAFDVGRYTDEDIRVTECWGSEGISQLFEFEIELASENDTLDFDEVVGKPGLLTIFHDGGERYVSGVVRTFEQGSSGVQFTRYRATLVPSVWLLTQRARSRIFEDKSTRDIVQKVLEEGEIPSDRFRFSLRHTYKPRNYCVQYRETDFTFIARLLEEEGIFYFFEHSQKGDVLVMGDWPGTCVPIAGNPEVIFREAKGQVMSEEHVSTFTLTEDVRPGTVVLKDYAFKKPTLDLKVSAEGKKHGKLEVYDYPGEYTQADLGNRIAQVRLDELQATRRLAAGESSCRRFVPGYCFKLPDHPRSDFNAEYLLVRAEHWMQQRQALGEEPDAVEAEGPVYRNQFECIPSRVPFRPARVTPRPVVTGVQTAVVVGPQGEEIYCDEHGRIKVQFHWDRDSKPSCWVRVGQAWAGTNWGFITIPRIGQEVMVDFLEGDPDRPIVTGSVYNADQAPPYKLPDHKTRSTLKSNTVHGEGFNELRFEDAKDKEQVFIHGQKDMDLRIKGSYRDYVGGGRHQVTEGTHNSHVDENLYLKVLGNVVLEVGMKLTLRIDDQNFIEVGPEGVTIEGSMVQINCGRPATGSIPQAPEEADHAEALPRPSQLDVEPPRKSKKRADPADLPPYHPQGPESPKGETDREQIDRALDLIKKSAFAKTAKGQKVLAKLTTLQKAGKLVFAALPKRARGAWDGEKASVNQGLRGNTNATASELVHEGGHAVDDDDFPDSKGETTIDGEMRTDTDQLALYEEQRTTGYRDEGLERRRTANANGKLRDDVRRRYPDTAEH